jgi:hypothetical protein
MEETIHVEGLCGGNAFGLCPRGAGFESQQEHRLT